MEEERLLCHCMILGVCNHSPSVQNGSHVGEADHASSFFELRHYIVHFVVVDPSRRKLDDRSSGGCQKADLFLMGRWQGFPGGVPVPAHILARRTTSATRTIGYRTEC